MRFGVLGAATINRNAIFHPCSVSPQDAVVVALAARDRARADEHKEKHALTECEVFGSYQDLLDHADIDAVYIPTPNGLHYEWTMKALEAGKHVLCEKPFASNAEEARIMVQAAKERGLVLMEASHWFYHPFRSKMQQILASGMLGDILGLYANFSFAGEPGEPRDKKEGQRVIRYDSSLAGGAMMDLGWYALSCLRVLMGGQVPEVLWAQAQRWTDDAEIDEGMRAGLRFAGGIEGEIACSYAAGGSDGFMSPTAPGSSGSTSPPGGPEKHPMGDMRWDAVVEGTRASMSAVNYGMPHRGNRIIVTGVDGTQLMNETVDSGGFTTYDLMVLAFCSHVRQVKAGWVTSTEAFENTGREPIRQMEVVDRIYAKAGLRPRTGPAAIVSKL